MEMPDSVSVRSETTEFRWLVAEVEHLVQGIALSLRSWHSFDNDVDHPGVIFLIIVENQLARCPGEVVVTYSERALPHIVLVDSQSR